MTISRRLRFEILRRDGHTCRYCGRRAPEVPLTVDHVHPVTLGGQDDPSNLVTACKDCNNGKSSIPPGAELVADVANDALRWAQALKEAAWCRAQERSLAQATIDCVDEEWRQWRVTLDGKLTDRPTPRPPDWMDTVRKWYLAGLDNQTIVELVGVAMRRTGVAPADTWTYFCGCCWRELDRIQDLAKDIVRANDPMVIDAIDAIDAMGGDDGA